MIRWAILIAAAMPAILQATVSQAPDAAPNLAPAADSSAVMPEGDEEAGREIYAESCRACHSGAIAPSLKGVIDRPVASVEGYAYSDGLKARAGMVWTQANLHAFMADPAGFAPGTKMKKPTPDPQQRADILAYISSLSE